MKYSMKTARIPNEIQWKHPALIMKEAMKAAKIPNEIFNENSQNS
jgi:hypothetical protein